MVLHKKLNYGFPGYQDPPVPRAARSARRRAPLRKCAEENQTCAFDLLASVAGKILLEGQTSATSFSNGECQEENDQNPLKEEQHDAIKPLNLDPGDRDISEVRLRVHDVTSQSHDHSCKDNLIGTCPGGPISEATSSGFSDNIISDGKRVVISNQNRLVCQSRKLERCSSGLDDHHQEQIHSLTVRESLVGIGSNGSNSQDLRFHIRKSRPTLVCSDGCCKPNLIKKDYACHSVFPSRYKSVKVVNKDDDKKPSRCTRRNAYRKMSRFPARYGDWRIRKLLGSRYCRMYPSANVGDLSDYGKQFPMTHQNWKQGYKRQRSQRVYGLKKWKLFRYCSSLSSGGTTGCEGIYDSRVEPTTNMSASHFANSILTSANDSQVKLKIKSFRVPELYIDIPKTATVGSLKKTVMEAISSLLGEGLRVGVQVKGRKIKDDSETLFQTGIFHDGHLDSLGFTIEPNPSQASSAMYSDDLPSRDITQPVLSGMNQSAEAPSTAHQYNLHPSPDCLPNSVGHCVGSDHDSAPSPAEVSKERCIVESSSRALVNVPELDADAHAVVLSQQKSKGSEMAQRRIRRPFSVSEVEALVQAVEKLGTGRWRDVKLHAFDNVKHRTYVDLKDKWKTLVHTARISPQQRRGEPVPQELLDKVIAAHAYWSQQQAKQRHLKTPHLRHVCLL